MPSPSRDTFLSLVSSSRTAYPTSTLAIPLSLRLLADQLTPVLGYRRLVAPDERHAPSFLFESVEGGERQGRHSILGAQPALEVIAKGRDTRILAHRSPAHLLTSTPAHPSSDPLQTLRALSANLRLILPPPIPRAPLPACFLGGWVGFAGYDTVRYAEPEKLAHPPRDDRNLPDLHFGFYDGVAIFDHVDKLVHLIELALVAPGADPLTAYESAATRLHTRLDQLNRHSKPLPSGIVEPEETRGAGVPPAALPSNLSREQHASIVARAKEYIAAGDIFQVVLGQRFERRSTADPFDVYRALRAVNPSPYMVYLQAQGCILVASSPEILCRVALGTPPLRDGSSSPPHLLTSSPAHPPIFTVTNRPLAGTRRRGQNPSEDLALERELLADPKERAEHIMLVDLGRNDVGRVAVPGTVSMPKLMEVERYSHVMHISSTVTGELRADLDCWDALRATLPVGTISGAPKVRAMQIIDELEPIARGPYGGGIGYVGLDGQMDIALALRTMVVPTGSQTPPGATARPSSGAAVPNAQHPTSDIPTPTSPTSPWTYHLQAAGGIVADSDPSAEYQETVNKAAALARAIDLAERAFSSEISTIDGAFPRQAP